MKSPNEIVSLMYNNDPFSKWIGMERVLVEKGKCILRMTVNEKMLNGFNIAHGGITYSLADSALAFASNSRGIQSLSIETNINHLLPVKQGDVLTAASDEKNVTNKTALYIITVTNQDNKTVAIFKGLVYRTGKEW